MLPAALPGVVKAPSRWPQRPQKTPLRHQAGGSPSISLLPRGPGGPGTRHHLASSLPPHRDPLQPHLPPGDPRSPKPGCRGSPWVSDIAAPPLPGASSPEFLPLSSAEQPWAHYLTSLSLGLLMYMRQAWRAWYRASSMLSTCSLGQEGCVLWDSRIPVSGRSHHAPCPAVHTGAARGEAASCPPPGGGTSAQQSPMTSGAPR